VVLPISEVRRIADRVCARQDVLDACAERDLGYVIAFFEKNGLTQGQMASLTGLHQTAERLQDRQAQAEGILGLRRVRRRIKPSPGRAAGTGARCQPGAGYHDWRAAAQARVLCRDQPGLSGDGRAGRRNVSSLWRADLADQNVLVRAGIDPGAWKDASLRWLVDPVSRRRLTWQAACG